MVLGRTLFWGTLLCGDPAVQRLFYVGTVLFRDSVGDEEAAVKRPCSRRTLLCVGTLSSGILKCRDPALGRILCRAPLW